MLFRRQGVGLVVPALAGVLGERRRYIANDWRATELYLLVSRLNLRAIEILSKVDFSP